MSQRQRMVSMSNQAQMSTKDTCEQPRLSEQEIEQLDNNELLRLYKETGDQELKWALVLRMTDIIRRIAIQTCGIYSGFTQMDDVIHEGILVLLSAVDRFDFSKEVKFETYISKRLRGMIVDLARKQDWIPRQLRQKSIQLGKAMEELSAELGHTPTSQEVANHMGLTLEQYQETLSDTAVTNLISFEALIDSYGNAAGKLVAGAGVSNPPEEACEEKELYNHLKEGIEGLRENERLVLSLYYEQELTMKEIAQVLGVSAPRVSQIHSRAVQHLKIFMQRRVN